jgi:hypothetical protein
MIDHIRWSLMAGCVFLCSFAPAQEPAAREYVVTGFATKTMCHKLPAPLFTVGPSGGRATTKDYLTIKCIPGLLSFTFSIDASVPSAFDQNIYTFRWGKSVVPLHTPFGFKGQFTDHEKLCTELADLFYSTLSNVVNSTSRPESEPMHWSATCNPDDQLGISMEIELSPHAEVRHPRQPQSENNPGSLFDCRAMSYLSLTSYGGVNLARFSKLRLLPHAASRLSGQHSHGSGPSVY